MLADLFVVKKTKNTGKGLFAKEFIPKGTVVYIECEKCRKIPKKEFEKLDKKQQLFIINHAYTQDDGTVVIECGNSIFSNHSCNANILKVNNKFDIAVKDIKKGEEVTYDYRSYKDYLYLGKEDEWPCLCRAKECGKKIFYKPPSRKLNMLWKKQVNSAIKLINKVDQPLREELIKRSMM